MFFVQKAEKGRKSKKFDAKFSQKLDLLKFFYSKENHVFSGKNIFLQKSCETL